MMTLPSIILPILWSMLSLERHTSMWPSMGSIILERVSCPGYIPPLFVKLNANEMLIGHFLEE